jgi:hypothetical protein
MAAQLAANPLHTKTALGLLGLVAVEDSAQAHVLGPLVHGVDALVGGNTGCRRAARLTVAHFFLPPLDSF